MVNAYLGMQYHRRRVLGAGRLASRPGGLKFAVRTHFPPDVKTPRRDCEDERYITKKSHE